MHPAADAFDFRLQMGVGFGLDTCDFRLERDCGRFLGGLPRLFRGHFDSHRLVRLEVELLEFERDDDCPSYEVPARYFRFQRSGDPTHILPVLRHNAWDILSLVALAAQGRNIRLSVARVEGYRHFVNKIWNASRFALMNLTGFEADRFADGAKQHDDMTLIVMKVLQAALQYPRTESNSSAR